MNLLIITQKVDSNDQLLGFFVGWLRLLAGKFGKITIICLEKGNYNLPNNVNVISLGKDQCLNKLSQLFNFYFLIFTLQRQYQAVFVHMNPIWMVLGGVFWRMMNKRSYLWYTHKAVTLKLRIAEKMAHKIFTASKESFRLASKKVVVTGHGINTDVFIPTTSYQPSNTSLKILSVGRIAPVKNYETLIEAAKILKDEGIVFSVTIVGEAPLDEDKNYESRIKLQIKNLNLEDRFNFVGKINHENLPTYYQSHDIFIHTSKTGSLDKTILEAMACGMKVLSSNDASRGFLSDEMIFNDTNARELADKILKQKISNSDPMLRYYVVAKHSLGRLIDNLAEIIIGEIAVYPFPYSSKNNKYSNLLYDALKKLEPNHFKLIDCKDSFLLLLRSVKRSTQFRKNIIHIHWANNIYGSTNLFKSVLKLSINLSILFFLKFIAGYKIVWTQHNYHSHHRSFPVIDNVSRMIIRLIANRIVIQQKSEYLKHREDNKFLFIPHGNYIDAYGSLGNRNKIRSELKLFNDQTLFFVFGVVKPYKKIECIIESFKDAKNPKTKLLIAGRGSDDYIAKLRSMVVGVPNIRFLSNFIDDSEISDYLAAADFSVFWYDDSVLTSGGILLSLSYGLPVVVRDIPAGELINHKNNGLIYNSKADLVGIFQQASDYNFDRAEVIASVRHLNWHTIAESLMQCFSSI